MIKVHVSLTSSILDFISTYGILLFSYIFLFSVIFFFSVIKKGMKYLNEINSNYF